MLVIVFCSLWDSKQCILEISSSNRYNSQFLSHKDDRIQQTRCVHVYFDIQKLLRVPHTTLNTDFFIYLFIIIIIITYLLIYLLYFFKCAPVLRSIIVDLDISDTLEWIPC